MRLGPSPNERRRLAFKAATGATRALRLAAKREQNVSGEQVLVSELEAFPRRIAVAAAGLGEFELRRQPAAGEFSILENVAHLRDLEIEGTSVRIRRVLSESNPTLSNFDGAAVAAASTYNDEDFADALTAFTLARRRNVLRLRSLVEAGFARPATFGSRILTLAAILEMLRAHDAEHGEAIEAIASRLRGQIEELPKRDRSPSLV